MASADHDLEAVQREVKLLLAAALSREAAHSADMARRDEQHVAEMDRRDHLHVAEMDRRDHLHLAEVTDREDLHRRELDLLRAAIESRDLIGQAKGVIIASLGCDADTAFSMLRTQSQHENRKVTDIAQEIVERAIRAKRPPLPPVG